MTATLFTVVTFGNSFGLAGKAHATREAAEKVAERIRQRSNNATTARVVECSGATRAAALRKVRAADIGA